MRLSEADIVTAATLHHYEWCAEHHIAAPKISADPPEQYQNIDFKTQTVSIWTENDGRIRYHFSFDQEGRIRFQLESKPNEMLWAVRELAARSPDRTVDEHASQISSRLRWARDEVVATLWGLSEQVWEAHGEKKPPRDEWLKDPLPRRES